MSPRPGFRRPLLSLLLVVAVASHVGCAGYARRRQLSGERRFRLALTLERTTGCPEIKLRYDPVLALRQDYEAREGERLRVEFPRARAIAGESFERTAEAAIVDEWRRHGIELAQKPLVQFHAVACWPAPLTIEVPWLQPSESPYLPIPLPMLASPAPLAESVAGVGLPILAFFNVAHDLTEFAMATSPRGTVLIDRRALGLVRRNYGTRWFREGAATLVGSAICERLDLATPFTREAGEEALIRVGPAILDWSRTPAGEQAVADAYGAAYALISRIADASPGGNLAALMAKLREYDYVDRARLREVIQAVTGRPPEEFAAPAKPR